MKRKVNEFMPVAIGMKGRDVLIVGGGNVAGQKIASLLRFTRRITVVAPEISDAVRKSGVKRIVREYRSGDLRGKGIVYACTGSAALNRRIRRDARAAGVLVNVVDNPAMSDFVSPAIYRAGHMAVAVTSNGLDVKRAVRWRNAIKEYFENGNTPE
ncbi:MAG TPA: NAD(P)-dependent oxidoreductase [bacterium]|nr:NAD(P)-dependent oxidoreductase [bacterium]